MKTLCSTLTLVWIVLAGCSTTTPESRKKNIDPSFQMEVMQDPSYHSAILQAIDVQHDEDNHLAKAEEFLEYARNSQIEEMMGVVSRYMIDSVGGAKLQKAYHNQIVPIVQERQIEQPLQGRLVIAEVNDNTRLSGWEFAVRESGTSEVLFKITVLKEDGEYLVSVGKEQ